MACDIGKGCVKGFKGPEEPEDVQLLVSGAGMRKEKEKQEKPVNESSKRDLSGKKETFSPVSGRTRGQRPVIQAPLRQAIGVEGIPLFACVPFTTLDLFNWKHAVGPYHENQKKCINY